MDYLKVISHHSPNRCAEDNRKLRNFNVPCPRFSRYLKKSVETCKEYLSSDWPLQSHYLLFS